jgi:serine/threonine-protein kinase HipA
MDLANKVLDDRKRLNVHLKGPDSKKESAMRDILRVGVSAGGAVPKAIIAINEDNHIISGQADIPEGYSHWIIKFDGINQDRFQLGKSNDNGRVEYAYYLMAKEAGIDMPECRLLEENGRSHFMIRRFDREHNRKFHTLSLSCMGHYGWNPIGSSSYEMAFQIMRALSLPYPEQEEQYRRMVFNAVARNVDDHVKNISYVMDRDGTWHLSPAYDVTFSVNPEDALGEMHKISLNGKRDDFTYEDFIEVAENTGINNAEDIIEEVLDVVSEWHEFAIESRVSPEIIKYVGNQHIDKQQLDNRSSMSPRP